MQTALCRLHSRYGRWGWWNAHIRYELEDEHDLIVEGWQLLPSHVSALLSPHERRLAALFL